MKQYKTYELIKLNIKQFISEMKSQRQKKRLIRLDRLVQRIPTEKLRYEDLAPETEIKNSQEYINALFWAIKNKNVKNIALTGPYGSGKSSIIKSYLAIYPSSKALNVSLATFDLNKEDNKDFEKEIELGILKQLFYKVDSDKIPQSRYRKIKKKYYKRYFGFIAGAAIVTLLGVAFFSPDTAKKAVDIIGKSREYYGIKTITSYIISCLFGLLGIGAVAYVLKWCMSSFKVKEVNIADKATVVDDKDESSIFDKSMDELVYFFEATDYNIVFIEDLDRFDSTKIFIKLRELNTILNNYDLIRRRIVFVYAIKDDMFKNEERTKFFDFIIPVIPIINSTNSGEIIREKLMVKKQDDGSFKSSLFDISSSYITLISPFIEDMRVLINICNEFIVYKNTLKSVKLDDEEMFSMMILKSLYPKEFSELEAEKGIVKKAFEEKIVFIKSKKRELDTERVNLEQILTGIEEDIFNSVQDVKAAFLNYLIDTDGPFIECSINRSTYYYHQIMDESFDMNKFKTQEEIRIRGYRNNRCVNGINEDKYVEYLRRIEYLKNNEESRKNEIRNKIWECNKKVTELYSYSLKKLIEIYGSREIFSKEVQENKLLIFLLRKGFINENYADYINYFYPNSITKEEMNFIRGIRMQEVVGDYSYSIRNVEQVCERIETYEFKQIEILNFDIVDYLITYRKDSEQCKELFIGLSNVGEKTYDFIKAYIERKKNVGVFIKLLCKRCELFWNQILNDELLTEDKKFEYLVLILEYADLHDICVQNEMSYINDAQDEMLDNEEEYSIEYEQFGIREFIESNVQALSKLSNVQSNKMINVIESLGIYFRNCDIQGTNKEVLKFVFENNYYKLNIQMLRSLFEFYFPDKIQQLNIANYTVIRNVEFEPLNDRLEDINEFKEYVSELVVKQNSNIGESINSVENILERLFNVDLELCKKVLNQENIVWNDITKCCICPVDKTSERKLIWDYIFEKGQVQVSWNNFIAYYNEYQLTHVLVKWIDKFMAALIRQDRMQQITDKIVKEIIIQNISINSLDEITKAYVVDEFNVSLSEFDSEKISILIKNKYIPYSNKYLKEMYQVAPSRVLNYIIYNKEEFIRNITSAEVKIDTIVKLLRSRCFTKDEIIKLLELVSISDINQDMAIEIQKLENLLPKEYVEKSWNLLKEEDRYQLLLNQFDNYSVTEIALKLAELAPDYQKLSDLTRKHKEHLSIDNYGYNEKLLNKLKDIGYLSSVKIVEYYETDTVTQKNIKKHQFEVWVKKQ